MKLPGILTRLSSGIRSRLAKVLFPIWWKEKHELSYWQHKKKTEGTLSNDHYEHFYTRHFGIEKDDYKGKVIMDLGCGPRGSLEWATTAARTIGVDPLANAYLELGAREHRMEYIAAPAEKIPLKDGECDAVFSFNSLDHVEDVERVIGEIKRVTRPGGIFLLLVEVNHPPTDTEPHRLTQARLLNALRPEFSCDGVELYKPVVHGMYQSILADQKLPDPENTTEIGYLSAKFVRSAR